MRQHFPHGLIEEPSKVDVTDLIPNTGKLRLRGESSSFGIPQFGVCVGPGGWRKSQGILRGGCGFRISPAGPPGGGGHAACVRELDYKES